MAKSESSRKIQKLVLDSDMAVVAQQLLQLSDDQEDGNSNSSSIVKKNSLDDHQEEIDQGSPNEFTWQKKIEEIFGKNEEVYRPMKRKYRSLVEIYQATKPIHMPVDTQEE